MMNKLLKTSISCLLLASGLTFTACDSDEPPVVPPPANSKYTVGANVDGEGYYLTTDDIQTGDISVVGNGFEGWANLSVSVDGYLYILNNTEALTEKFELTDNGPVKVDAISNSALVPEGFFRYIINTGTGDLFLMDFPNEEGKAPYAIIDLQGFTVESFGLMDVPDVNGKNALWTNALVEGDKIYLGSLYGDRENWTQLSDSLITVKYDYPSLANPEVLVSTASAGTTAGYRTNGTFKVENGDIYQYNLNSFQWNGNDELAGKPTVFVRIKDGEYDDSYVLDVSAEYNEPIAIWNAWYAGNNIVYANIVKEADIPAWGDLLQNTGTLVEINLASKSVTELNLPKATYRDVYSLNCIEDGKFYVPVSVTGGDANIYEITVGGGADGFRKGARLDGSNVFVNALVKNF
ncbi:hypothetical protein [Algoriphagus sp. Y33]|uniref:hypothetical protein n=1 Tax=Algoriphagus sp. Y33 TaxID=2772483 RepID=UPI001780F2D2|nr:hypothetical protein [Algoriphagus sp. Y33]